MQITKSLQSILTNASASVNKGDSTQYESVWVWACVNAIANNIASVPFKLRDKAGRILTDKKDKMVYLFSRPNPILNSTELLIRHTMAKYEVTGQVFWLFNDDNLKPAKKNPTRIDVVSTAEAIYSPTNTKVQIGWKVDQDIYDFNNCIRFANMSPAGGLAVISSKTMARQSINIDTKLHNYNEIFFEQGAQINGYLLDDSGEGMLSEDEAKKLQASWDSQFSSWSNAHRTPVLTGGLKYVATGSTHKDMDFLNLNNVIKEEILAAFGVPSSQLSVGNASYASSKVADRQFFTNNLIPKMNYIASVLNSTIFYLTGYECFFDYTTIEPLKEERQAKLQGAKDLFDLGYSLNEINALQKLGMDEIPDAWASTAVDARAIQTNLAANSAQANKPEPTNHGSQAVAQDNTNANTNANA